ncbi:hypothetical protein JTT01_16275 [Clostridium botulinum]|nr:hypothetical protein [Clostridium botulinum]
MEKDKTIQSANVNGVVKDSKGNPVKDAFVVISKKVLIKKL